MPIIESLWHGKPCVCYSEGVMGELAKEGGCYTVDVRDIDNLCDGLLKVSTDKGLYERLCAEAVSRKIKTWKEYAQRTIEIIEDNTNNETGIPLSESGCTWQSILFHNCVLDGWQMNDSEKSALKSVLMTLEPKCSIEIGTYKGGSLSLISQFSDIVFSIDIDEEVKEKFACFRNVVFLTGPSEKILPLLFNELRQKELSPDFILVDGDHSCEGVRRDINLILDYKPQKPMMVLMHDSFNPECRKGMLASDWRKTAYLQDADLDFVPGRIVEIGGGLGEMWGGLGMAFFTPVERKENPIVRESSLEMFEILKRHCYGNQ
jgi:hypothetical protein